MSETDRNDDLWMVERIVALIAEARDAGWKVRSLQTGDFEGSTTIELVVWRRPAPPPPPEEDPPAAAGDSPRTETGGGES